MPLEIIRNDITKVHTDAIVNAANSSLLGGGGVDEAIHRAAGPELLEECRTLCGCKTGQAKITKGYNLPAKYVIHTVGPVWHGGNNNEGKLLADCYRNSLELARQYQLESIAFPLISAGAYGYPNDQALKIAISVIGEFLMVHEMLVYLVVFDKAVYVLSEKLFSSIKEYIDDKYTEEFMEERSVRRSQMCQLYEDDIFASAAPSAALHSAQKARRKLDDVVAQLDETFSQMLQRLIDEKGMTDVETYKRANIDRKLFSKIRSDIQYKPSKSTAIAFAISLRLSLDETKDLLLRAGYALSHSSKFDIIIEYFIEEGNYNIFEINEALFAFEQSLLG
jgi:O-acetyl-ADP-ribose deacetylase (regulator of RNase III)